MIFYYALVWCWNLWWSIDNLRTHKPHALVNALVISACACVLLVLQVLLLAHLEGRESDRKWRRACMRETELGRLRLRKAAQELWLADTETGA